MSNIRDGKVKVFFLKLYVSYNVNRLKKITGITVVEEDTLRTRNVRQLVDGEKFLTMLNESTYCNCKTIDELKQKISKKRNKLKRELVALDESLDGHQLSFFTLTEAEKEERNNKIKALKEEIHWLHKCLGICKNTDYFN